MEVKYYYTVLRRVFLFGGNYIQSLCVRRQPFHAHTFCKRINIVIVLRMVLLFGGNYDAHTFYKNHLTFLKNYDAHSSYDVK